MKTKKTTVKQGLGLILQTLSKKIFLVLLLLLLLDVILGALFFWYYSLNYSAEKAIQSQALKPLKVNQALIDEFSAQWEAREQLFQQASTKQYIDVFHGF